MHKPEPVPENMTHKIAGTLKQKRISYLQPKYQLLYKLAIKITLSDFCSSRKEKNDKYKLYLMLLKGKGRPSVNAGVKNTQKGWNNDNKKT